MNLTQSKNWLLYLLFSFILYTASAQVEQELSYNWESPLEWGGGNFSVPPWFAENLNYHGHEVLHFHPDYYNYGTEGFWTYNFALIVNELDIPTTNDIVNETRLYFVGLGRILGDHKNSELSIDEIEVKALGDWKKNGHKNYQKYLLQAFDPWETGKAIMLHVRVTTWLCENKNQRVIIYSISPKDFDNQIWKLLKKDSESFECK